MSLCHQDAAETAEATTMLVASGQMLVEKLAVAGSSVQLQSVTSNNVFRSLDNKIIIPKITVFEKALAIQLDQNVEISSMTTAPFHIKSTTEVAELLKQLAMKIDKATSLYYELNCDDDSESYDTSSGQDDEEIYYAYR
jgi:hypothetical protein